MTPLTDFSRLLAERDEVRLNHLMAENRFTRLGASRSAMWCIGKRRNDADGPIFPTPTGQMMLIALMKGPGDFAL